MSCRIISSDNAKFVVGGIFCASFTISTVFFMISSCIAMSLVSVFTMMQSGFRLMMGLIESEISSDGVPGWGLNCKSCFLFILLSSRLLGLLVFFFSIVFVWSYCSSVADFEFYSFTLSNFFPCGFGLFCSAFS